MSEEVTDDGALVDCDAVDNVVNLPVITKLDLPAERILQAALKQGMSEVVICGFDSDGEEYFASSQADGGDTLWHLARAQHRLLRMPDGESS